MFTDELLRDATAFVFVSSLKAALVVALVLLVQKLCGRFLSAYGRYVLWFPLLAALVTPIGFNLEIPLLSRATNERAASAIETQPAGTESATLQPVSSPPLMVDAAVARDPGRFVQVTLSEATPRAITALEVVQSIWLAGAVIALAAILHSGRRLTLLLRRAKPAPPWQQALLKECMQRSRCRTPIRLLCSAEAQIPMVVGLLKPALLLPEGIGQELSYEQLRHVFLHEITHVRRGDIAGNWLLALLQAVHWFNPMLWLAFARLRHDRELVCDAETLRHLAAADRAAYGRTLLQLNDRLTQLRVPAMALGMLQPRTQLHLRILMLSRESSSSLVPRVITVMAALPLAALAFSQPVPATRAEPAVSAQLAAAPAPVAAIEPVVAAQPAPLAAASAGEDIAPRFAPGTPQPDTTEATLLPEPPAPVAPASTVTSQELQLDAEVALPAEPAPFTQRQAPAVLAAVTAAPPPSPEEEAADLLEIEELTATISAAKEEKLRFIEKWDAIGQKCEARKDGFLGVLSASCQRIRTAQRRGEFFRFAFNCFQLNSWQQQLQESLSDPAPSREIEAALRANAAELDTFCSRDTNGREHPAFAAMVADAESLKFFPRRGMISDTAMVARMNVDHWRSGLMTTGSSMFTSGASSFSVASSDPGAGPIPVAGADLGGASGGAGTAPVAPPASQ